ncbi:hypothetical protein [Streptomyces sp. NBC_01439]|uniref:hypothetical protein n=1 Tax=Streptomyces sp. NBC_01439 TaxID=2903867 RepID=UPI002E2C9A96|nr:hypothetical protein [Streptomyces sp. NBC_01439]
MTSPSPALVDAILAAAHPTDVEEQLLAADAATIQTVLDVLDAERRETLRISAAWKGLADEAGPYSTGRDDTLAAMFARMPADVRARAMEHVRVLEAAGVAQAGPGL